MSSVSAQFLLLLQQIQTDLLYVPLNGLPEPLGSGSPLHRIFISRFIPDDAVGGKRFLLVLLVRRVKEKQPNPGDVPPEGIAHLLQMLLGNHTGFL